ncbi:NK-tumor recognition protein isoform X2, partial [Biomphalaria glabrata]
MRPSGKRDAAVAANAALKEKGKTPKKDVVKTVPNEGEESTSTSGPGSSATTSSVADKGCNLNTVKTSDPSVLSQEVLGKSKTSITKAGVNVKTHSKTEPKITIKTPVKALTRSTTRSQAAKQKTLLKSSDTSLVSGSEIILESIQLAEEQAHKVAVKEPLDTASSSGDTIQSETVTNDWAVIVIPLPDKIDVSEIEIPPPLKTEDVPLPLGSPKAPVSSSPKEEKNVVEDLNTILLPNSPTPDKSVSGKEVTELNKGSVSFSISKIPNKISTAPSAFNQDDLESVEVLPTKMLTLVESTEEILK